MNYKKAISLMLTLSMISATVACSTAETDTTAETSGLTESVTATVSEATEETADTVETTETSQEETETSEESEYSEVSVASVSDYSDKVVIYSNNKTFEDLLDKYCGDIEIDYRYFGGDADIYKSTIDAAIEEGDSEEEPDLIIMDGSMASEYMNTLDVQSVNSLGITYDELGDMFDYTLQASCSDEGVIMGISWQLCPSGIFYNRTLAETYLGVSEPEDVAPYFESWEKVIETCGTVNAASEGAVKVITGIDEIYGTYCMGRTQSWVLDGNLTIEPYMSDFYEYAKTLNDGELTFNEPIWTTSWNDHIKNGDVMTFWGPLDVFNYHIVMNDIKASDKNWGLVASPTASFNNGQWMIIPKTCDMEASVAEIIRAITLNEDNLSEMAADGIFVNSKSVMESCASDVSFCLDELGGQNPLPVLLDTAMAIDYPICIQRDDDIDSEFLLSVDIYVNGDAETLEDAYNQFEMYLIENDYIEAED